MVFGCGPGGILRDYVFSFRREIYMRGFLDGTDREVYSSDHGKDNDSIPRTNGYL